MSETGPVYVVDQAWDEFWIRYLFRPICTIIASFVVCSFITPMYTQALTKSALLLRFHQDWIGTADNEKVTYALPLTILYIMQFLGSMYMLIHYIAQTYYRESLDSPVEWIIYPFFLAHMFVTVIQNMFSPGILFGVEMMTDFFTVVPYYLHYVPNEPYQWEPDHGEWGSGYRWREYLWWSFKVGILNQGARHAKFSAMWINFSFLRARRGARAWDTFTSKVMPENWKGGREFYFAAFNIAFFGLALILGWAGICMTLEILGEPTFLHFPRIETGMGNLSYIQMFYWTMTTISTVGYGDFSPTTTLSRMVMCYVFVAGIIYFGTETAKIVELQKFLSSGRGRYKPHDGDFVVVSGMGVDGNENFLIPGFVSEMYHDDHAVDDRPLPLSDRWPRWIRKTIAYLTRRQGFREVVFLVDGDEQAGRVLDDEYREWVMGHVDTQKRSYIRFFDGDIQQKADCERIMLQDAYMCFIIPDAEAARSFDREQMMEHDLHNIMKAMSVRRNAESVKMRLCLLSSSKAHAVSFGLDPLNVLSLGEVTAAMTASSVRVWGCIPMLNGLLWTLHDNEVEELKMVNYSDPTLYKVMSEYLDGCNFQVYGLKLHRVYTGKRLKDVVRATYQKYQILVIAAQVDGRMILNPDIVITRQLIVFALARDSKSIRVLQASQGDAWENAFVTARRNAKTAALDFGHGASAADQDKLILKKLSPDGTLINQAMPDMDVGAALRAIRAHHDEEAQKSANMAVEEPDEEANMAKGGLMSRMLGRGNKNNNNNTVVENPISPTDDGSVTKDKKGRWAQKTNFAGMAAKVQPYQDAGNLLDRIAAGQNIEASSISQTSSMTNEDMGKIQRMDSNTAQFYTGPLNDGLTQEQLEAQEEDNGSQLSAFAAMEVAQPDSSADDVPDMSGAATLHVLVVVIGDQSWQEVIFTLARVQKDTVGRNLKLTVVSSQCPPKFENVLLRMGVFVYLGQLSNGPKLIQAGLLDADVIIVSHGTRRDAEVLSKLCTIKKLQIHAASDHAFVLCELKNGLQSLDVYTYVTRYHYMTRATGKKILSVPVNKHFIKSDDGIPDLGEALSCHEAYLSGGVLLADIFGYVMARMIYLPATIELFSVILQPTDVQNSIMAQVKVPPKFVGKKWSDLSKQWVGCKEGVLPLALYRTQEIALADGDTTDIRYNATMPNWKTELRKDDYVTVIAPREWVSNMGRKRLLRCGKQLSSAGVARGKRGNAMDESALAAAED